MMSVGFPAVIPKFGYRVPGKLRERESGHRGKESIEHQEKIARALDVQARVKIPDVSSYRGGRDGQGFRHGNRVPVLQERLCDACLGRAQAQGDLKD